LDDNPLSTAIGCAKRLAQFANLELDERTFDEALRPSAQLSWFIATPRVPAVSRHLPPGIGVRLPSYAEAQRLQRRVRRALADIAAGDDMRILLHEINRRAPYRYWLDAIPPRVGMSPALPISHEWRIAWVPAMPQTPTELVFWALGEAMTVAALVGRCERCRRFFVRRKRHRQRFCSEECSIAFHNAARIEDGYFKRRRQKRRGGHGSL
jgi:hypothetical protein